MQWRMRSSPTCRGHPASSAAAHEHSLPPPPPPGVMAALFALAAALLLASQPIAALTPPIPCSEALALAAPGADQSWVDAATPPDACTAEVCTGPFEECDVDAPPTSALQVGYAGLVGVGSRGGRWGCAGGGRPGRGTVLLCIVVAPVPRPGERRRCMQRGLPM